jgi:hypothetical protein
LNHRESNDYDVIKRLLERKVLDEVVGLLGQRVQNDLRNLLLYDLSNFGLEQLDEEVVNPTEGQISRGLLS